MVRLKFKDMGRVMKLTDLFGPYAAYVKKNESQLVQNGAFGRWRLRPIGPPQPP